MKVFFKKILSRENQSGIFTIAVFVLVFCTVSGCSSDTSKKLINSIEIKANTIPLLIEKDDNLAFTIKLDALESGEKMHFSRIKLQIDHPEYLKEIKVVKEVPAASDVDLKYYTFASEPSNTVVEFNSIFPLSSGENIYHISLLPTNNVNLLSEIEVTISEIGESKEYKSQNVEGVFRFGKVLRAAGQDSCDTYRIPGIITTNEGTLIAVYDNRYNSKVDLQEDVDVGLSRSADGGETWETMKVIMDMGEWGGNPQSENGIGDPCILFDNVTNTIWVSALWMHGHPGERAWNASQPGLEPEETGQFVLAKSEDDGITWSKPINITKQIKNPQWQLLLQGPGMGIAMKNETLVFPAQFKDKDRIPFSTIVYSEDHGTTWHIGTGAKSNTTEAQVVELSDGSLMLNMRDNRNRQEKGDNNGRAVAVTSDMGQTWQTHLSSNSILPESVCMASLISADLNINGGKQKVLFFSNPNDKESRRNMTIKASIDEGKTWPVEYRVLLNEDLGYGYSCLTMIDEKTIGIIYEGVKELYFQKVAVKDILHNNN